MKKILLMFIVLVLPFVVACGKKTDPVPQKQTATYAWKGAKAVVYDDFVHGLPARVLHITADIDGSVDRIKSFVLEIEPQTADVCGGCPFLPSETVTIEPTDIIYATNGTRYSFTYCPQKSADAYRWRLAAHDVRPGIPHTFTKVYGPTR